MSPDGDSDGPQGEGPPAAESVGTAFPTIDPQILELDSVFEVLANKRRRYLLYALSENPEWTLRELATKLVAWEQDVDESAVDARSRDRAYVALYHMHVPKLVDEGVIEFDGDTETLRASDHAAQVLAVLAGAGSSIDLAQEQHAERNYDGHPDDE